MNSRLLNLRALALSAACLVLAGPATPPEASTADPVAAPERVLTVIDGVEVTTADANALRAILQPPPSKEQAERLAVDAALAWWDMYGWLAASSAQGRLDAWRSWLVAGEDLGEGSVIAAIEDLKRRLQVGAYGSPRAERALELNRRSGREARAVRLRWLRISRDGAGEFRDVILPLRSVDPILALSLGQMEAGQVAGPIAARSGVFWVQRDPR